MSFTYRYKIGDTKWSEERPTDLDSFMELCTNFEWPKDDALEGKDWDRYKSALLLKRIGNSEELELAAMDTEAIVICYTPNGTEGYQTILEISNSNLTALIKDAVQLFFENNNKHFLSKYEPVKYSNNKVSKKTIRIPNELSFDNFSLTSIFVYATMPLLFLIPWKKNPPSFYVKVAATLVFGLLFLPKIILLILHSIKSKKYNYLYSVRDNKIHKYKDEKLIETLEDISEIHFVTEHYFFGSFDYSPSDLGYIQFLSKNSTLRISTLQFSFDEVKGLSLKPKTKSYQRSYPWI